MWQLNQQTRNPYSRTDPVNCVILVRHRKLAFKYICTELIYSGIVNAMQKFYFNDVIESMNKNTSGLIGFLLKNLNELWKNLFQKSIEIYCIDLINFKLTLHSNYLKFKFFISFTFFTFQHRENVCSEFNSQIANLKCKY